MTRLTPLRRASSRCRAPPGIKRIKRAPVGVLRPRRRKIVRGDDDRRNAVASARRALNAVVRVGRRERLDPGLPDRGAADDAVEQIEGLGQHVVVGNRLKLRHVDPLQERAQPKRLGRRRPARTRGQRVARVENHRAAVFHERGDARARLGLGLRQPGDDRPIDERIESEFVARRIEPDRLGKLGRGAGSEHPRQRRQPELRGFVDRRIAGHDIGEPGGQGRIHIAIGDRRRFGGARLVREQRRGRARRR